MRPKVAIGTQWKFLRLANFCPPRSLSVLASVRANGILQQSRRRETNRLFAEISAYIGNPTTSGTSLARSPQAGRLLIGQRLIIVWLEVRVLPAPPRSPIQTEISRCHANSAEPPGFRASALSLLTTGWNVTGLFDAAVSALQNPVSRKQRPTVAESDRRSDDLSVRRVPFLMSVRY